MKNKNGKVLKAKYWLSIVYPESAAEGWLDILSDLQLGVAVSPLHDSDIDKEGKVKKPHYHIILEFPNTTTITFPQMVIDQIGGVGCFQCISIKASTRYLTHMDNPEKAQYSEDDVKIFGGFDYQSYIHMVSDDHKYLKEILRFIVAYRVYSFRDLALFAMDQKEEWFSVIAYRSSIFIKEFMNSCIYSEGDNAILYNPDGFRNIDGTWYSKGKPIEV